MNYNVWGLILITTILGRKELLHGVYKVDFYYSWCGCFGCLFCLLVSVCEANLYVLCLYFSQNFFIFSSSSFVAFLLLNSRNSSIVMSPKSSWASFKIFLLFL